MDENSRSLATLISISGGGVLGSLAAISIKKPQSKLDGAIRTFLGFALSITCTGWVCGAIGIGDGEYSKITAVGLAVGFASFHIFSIFMMLLDSLMEKVDKKRLGFVGEIVKAIRGGDVSEILKAPEVSQVTKVTQVTTIKDKGETPQNQDLTIPITPIAVSTVASSVVTSSSSTATKE